MKTSFLTAAIALFSLCNVHADKKEKAIDMLGKDLSAWQGSSGGEPSAGWELKDGVLVRNGKAGYIWTKERFDNFVLDLEFNTEGNSGVFIRTDNVKNPVQTGIEVQVNNPGGPNRNSVGSLYDLVAPSKDASKGGEWNHMVITVNDNMITVELNGEKVTEMDLDKWTEGNKNPDGSKNKFKTPLKDFVRDGHIGFQDHGAKVSYRNVRITNLD